MNRKLSVLDWAKERLANSQRIADLKTGADRESWLEDVWYWREIVARLGEAHAHRQEANRQRQRNSELDAAHKKLKGRYKQALDLIGELRLAARHAVPTTPGGDHGAGEETALSRRADGREG